MTEDEARAILAEVEPKHAHEERQNARAFAPRGGDRIDLRPHAREAQRGQIIDRSDWRPRATRTPSGWAISGGWLDEPVPPLPARTEHTGPVGMRLFAVANATTGDGLASLADRYGRDPGWVTGTLIGGLLQTTERCAWDYTEGESLARKLGVSPERTQWHEARRAARRYPSLEVGRGWCPELGQAIEEEIPLGTPEGWLSMQTALAEEMAAHDAAWAAERAELTQRTEAA